MDHTENRSVSNVKRYLSRMPLVLLTSAVVVYLITTAEHIHYPYLAAVVGAVAIGFVESRKGWILAIAQCITILSAYLLFTNVPDENSARREIETFSIFGSIILTFVASFIGGFIKRALD